MGITCNEIIWPIFCVMNMQIINLFEDVIKCVSNFLVFLGKRMSIVGCFDDIILEVCGRRLDIKIELISYELSGFFGRC